MDRNDRQLGRLDLNLLYAFQILMEELNVSRAAERLFISQPAMSNKLQRLRELFSDPLFMRHSHGLTPTPKALKLISPVSAALEQLAATLSDAGFQPAEAHGSVHIEIPDSFSIALLPPLYDRLMRSAPHLKLISDNTTDGHLDRLAMGGADFSIYLADDYGEAFITFELGAFSSVCWMRKGHPLSRKQVVSVDDIVPYPLAELSFVKHTPEKRFHDGLSKRFVEIQNRLHVGERGTASVGSSQLLTLLAIVTSTDTLLFGAPFLERLNPESLGLIYREVAEYGDLQLPLMLIQHRRTEMSPLHTWLRGEILAVGRETLVPQAAPVK